MSRHKEHPSKERLDELLRYEPDTGKLYWRVSRGSVKAGSEAGYVKSNGYLQVKIDGQERMHHNIIWIMNGYKLPSYPRTIDHKDRDPLNNRMNNLREATKRQQELNKLVRGFSRHKGAWKAMSRVLDKLYIGQYKTALQARLAYERVTSEAEPDFASTHFTDAINRLISSPS